MRGMTAAQTTMRDLLEQRIPARLAAIEARSPLWSDGDLAMPRLYGVRNRVQLDGEAWPAIIVDGRDAPSMERTDVVNGRPVYRITYRLRVLGFVRGDSGHAATAGRDEIEDTALRRDDLILAIREVLLEHAGHTLPAAGQEPATPLEVDESSLAESYSDVLPDELGRSIAAGYVDVAVIMEETLADDVARPDLGDLATVTVHPALLDD